jgi:two-component system cell cycle response regulator DivK
MSVRVLCVEDNPQNMRLVRKILSVAGYEVLEAVDGTSCLTVAQAQQPHLILMDVNLPDIDGLDVTRRLRADPQTTHIPVIALTANAMHGDRERCLEAGCAGYIPKPIAKQELLSTVHRFSHARSTKETAAVTLNGHSEAPVSGQAAMEGKPRIDPPEPVTVDGRQAEA